MKKIIILSFFISFKIFGQTPKMDVVVASTENIDGLRAVLNKTNPTNSYAAITGINKANNNFGYGVKGIHLGFGYGIFGESINGYGVVGFSENFGVFGRGTQGGILGLSNNGIGIQGLSADGTGGKFESTSGLALITGTGKIGLGNATPNLNSDERMEINGRLRIRDSTSTAGIWFNNTSNSKLLADGAFVGLKNNTETGFWIGNSWRFWVNNLGNATLTGTLTQSSDKRLKKEISPLKNSLVSINKLNGYQYKWIEKSRSKELQTGLIAQEVQKIFPELVQIDEKGFLSVNYIGLIPHLIESVKELKEENNSLKNQNQDLENNNKLLASRLDKFEEILSTIQPKAENFNSKK